MSRLIQLALAGSVVVGSVPCTLAQETNRTGVICTKTTGTINNTREQLNCFLQDGKKRGGGIVGT